MNKLCCIPFNEPPEVSVKLSCISACCASELDAKDDIACNTADKEVSHVKRSSKCCCGKKRKTFQSQAKEEPQDEKLKHE